MSEVELLTVKQAADLLGLRAQTLSLWRCQGRGPKYVRLGRAIRYARRDLDQFIQSSTVKPVQAAAAP